MYKSLMVLIGFVSFLFSCEHVSSYGFPKRSDTIICRSGYALGYSHSRLGADWVAYTLTPKLVTGEVDRTDNFRFDPDIPEVYRTYPEDYNEPVYDQGHFLSSESQSSDAVLNSETFYMSNMSPQLPGFNKAIWKGLENRERKWLEGRDELYIVVGTLYEGEIRYMKNRIPVPSHFFKIIYAPSQNEVIAFLIPHENIKTSALNDYITSIDEIEIRAGINVLNLLPIQQETELEKKIATSQW